MTMTLPVLMSLAVRTWPRPLDFGRSVFPIPTMLPPGFSDLPSALLGTQRTALA